MIARPVSFVVVAFGTSITANGGWQSVVEEKLQRCTTPSARIMTIAKPGANSNWGVFTAGLIINEAPDAVLIEFAINDASLWRGVSLSRSRRNLKRIVGVIRESKPKTKIFLVATNPVLGWRNIIRPRLNAYYNMVADVAAEEGVGFMDHRPAWAAIGPDALVVAMPDGLHPSSAASILVTEPSISKALCSLKPQSDPADK